LRKRLVDFNAVGWLKRAATVAGALVFLSAGLTVAAHAETRTLKLYNTHTKERVSITFKRNGRYLPEGLREANRFLRDWRRNEIIKMDPELLDLVWEVYQKVGARDHIHVVSSYRSPATNNMLRKRSSGVAKNSQHTLGKAMDFYIPGVNLAKLRATGLRQEVGGVGYYPRSGSPFVHMDTGSVRHWPKMSRSQLAKVFPDGKTLHIPSDGKPMSGYKIALAESKSGNSRKSRPTIVASSSPSRPTTRNQSLRNPGAPIAVKPAGDTQGEGNLFARLFGGADRDDNQTARPGAVGNTPPATRTASVSPVVDNPPIPARKVLDAPVALADAGPGDGAAPIVVASAAPRPPANTLDAQRAALESGQPVSPSQTIDSRFEVARAPAQKPVTGLSEAARAAAATLGRSADGTLPPVPAPAPADDPVAAIAAATGTSVPSPAPAPRPETTLAYASATATPASLNRPQRPGVGTQARAPSSRTGSASTAASGQEKRPTVSGRIPRSQIRDPLAGFAGLPDKSEPTLLSGAGTTRHQAFAWLRHPNQRALENVMMPGNRFVAASFENDPNRGLRTDRFDGGPAVIVLPVRFAR
jgi:uncharacterized protein YcbK (DUF882 family)